MSLDSKKFRTSASNVYYVHDARILINEWMASWKSKTITKLADITVNIISH